jgi:hypothetical protein
LLLHDIPVSPLSWGLIGLASVNPSYSRHRKRNHARPQHQLLKTFGEVKMKKIVLSLAALGALSTAAFAESAYDKQLKRNMVEFPDHYAFSVNNASATYGDALAIDKCRFPGLGKPWRKAASSPG